VGQENVPHKARRRLDMAQATVANQKKIMANQGKILANQKRILSNQRSILAR
jgi:hypothetical protein